MIGADGFVAAADPLSPAGTSADGIFAAGTAAGPMDIVDAITAAGNAAMQAGAYLHRQQPQTADQRRMP